MAPLGAAPAPALHYRKVHMGRRIS